MRLGRRIGIGLAGGILILAGVVLSMPLVPGPGFAVILLGLGVLSLEFERPRVWLAWLKAHFRKAADRVRGRSPPRDGG